MRQVKVIWIDARSQEGWVERGELKIEAATIETIGFVVEESDSIICVAASVSSVGESKQFCGVMFIPKVTILYLTTLG